MSTILRIVILRAYQSDRSDSSSSEINYLSSSLDNAITDRNFVSILSASLP